MPNRRAVLMIRQAISPRLAIRIFLNILPPNLNSHSELGSSRKHERLPPKLLDLGDKKGLKNEDFRAFYPTRIGFNPHGKALSILEISGSAC
jgi:hypothetical protein